MQKIDKYKTETYEAGDYLVEIIIEKNGDKTAWLRHKMYGISSMMFGVGASIQGFEELVEDNLDYYIDLYEKAYLN